MSLYGALQSGVSGLIVQSSALSAIADNISNSNTVGYKRNVVAFNTLVTKQTSLTTYSSGGVQGVNQSKIDVQGLLSATVSSTDLGISGNGFFVVNESPKPTLSDTWAYTRSGDFNKSASGYLVNSGGYYAMGWSLMPWDGNENATIVQIDGFNYMKAYKDNHGNLTYVNDSVIDSTNLKAVNLNEVGGDASATSQIRYGANLPSSDPIFNPNNAAAGGRYNISTILYDSLGNSHNISYEYTKTGENTWSIEPDIPSGAASLALYSSREIVNDAADDVYAAIGQIEFSSLPDNHSYIKLSSDLGGDNPITYVYEFSTDGTTSYVPEAGEKVVLVDMSVAVVSIPQAVERFASAIRKTMPDGGRFAADDNRIKIVQSTSGREITVDASKCSQTIQSSANPNLVTGIPTGIYQIKAIDDELKNVGSINFISEVAADYVGKTVTLGNNVYEFYNSDAGGSPTSPNIVVDLASAIKGDAIDRSGVASSLYNALILTAPGASRYKLSGTTLEITQNSNGADIMVNMGESDRLTFESKDISDYETRKVTINGHDYTFTSTPSGADYEIDISNMTWNVETTPNDIAYRVANAITVNASVSGDNPSHYQVNGNSIIADQGAISATTATGSSVAAAGAGLDSSVYYGTIKDNGGTSYTSIGAGVQTLCSLWTFNGIAQAEEGSLVAGVRFNSDGSPKYTNLNNMSINWANGASNMTGAASEGPKVSVFSGNENTLDGLTHLSGEYTLNYTTQDGARYGSYSGVSVDENGIVRALFDNGTTRPIAIIPLATFVNPNGLEALSGNVWIATGYSGAATLRTASTAGAGEISASSLESSTVDLATEFTNMITVQRAYTAASKIITTADDMLNDLMNIKR